MRKLNLTTILTVVCMAFVPAYGFGQQTAENLILRDMNYLIYYPEGYNESDEKEWPLLIFLHGAGETGMDVHKLKVTGLPRNIEDGKQFPFIIVSPQEQQSGRGWDINALHEFYQKLMEKYPVDKDRVYLTGLSMGGYGTWNLAIFHPELFAAIIPICGGTHFPDMVNRLKHTPVWCFHGDDDTVVPLSESQKIVDILEENNGNVKFTVYPGVGHDSWTQTYQNDEIYEWLLQHKRVKNIAIELSPEILEQFVGEYKSEDTDNTIRFESEDGKLKVRFNNGEGPVLYPINMNQFFYDDYSKDYVTFKIDSDGKVAGVDLWGNSLLKQ